MDSYFDVYLVKITVKILIILAFKTRIVNILAVSYQYFGSKFNRKNYQYFGSNFNPFKTTNP